MIAIINFEQASQNTRHGIYGGMAGEKDGIIYENNPWIIKYSKSGRFMQTQNISYVSSSLFEYIESCR